MVSWCHATLGLSGLPEGEEGRMVSGQELWAGKQVSEVSSQACLSNSGVLGEPCHLSSVVYLQNAG